MGQDSQIAALRALGFGTFSFATNIAAFGLMRSHLDHFSDKELLYVPMVGALISAGTQLYCLCPGDAEDTPDVPGILDDCGILVASMAYNGPAAAIYGIYAVYLMQITNIMQPLRETSEELTLEETGRDASWYATWSAVIVTCVAIGIYIVKCMCTPQENNAAIEQSSVAQAPRTIGAPITIMHQAQSSTLAVLEENSNARTQKSMTPVLPPV